MMWMLMTVIMTMNVKTELTESKPGPNQHFNILTLPILTTLVDVNFALYRKENLSPSYL